MRHLLLFYWRSLICKELLFSYCFLSSLCHWLLTKKQEQLIMFCLTVNLIELILFGTCWVYLMFITICFFKFRKIAAISSLNISLSLSSSGTPTMHIFVFFMVLHRYLWFSLLFFIFLFLPPHTQYFPLFYLHVHLFFLLTDSTGLQIPLWVFYVYCTFQLLNYFWVSV